ncbi:MAG: MotA/TolQ/ExbB proton channel family protein [Methylotenera sp.]|nr:MotA/TolQ/ExbB proton channel family protein [Oligoflexia bacterium]
MQTLILGSLFSIAILATTFWHSKAGLSTFLNPEGLIIVLGGTVSILLMTSNKKELMGLFRQIKRLIFSKASKRDIREVLIDCSKTMEKGKFPSTTGVDFLDKSLGWLGAGLSGATLDKLLVDGAKLEIERIHQSANVLANIGKYPPALGMVGTVFGIIAIFNGLGNAEGQRTLGTNLAFAMTATLYGLVTSNFVISPLSELLLQAAHQEEVELSMIVETVKLWSDKESLFFVQEHIGLYHAS